MHNFVNLHNNRHPVQAKFFIVLYLRQGFINKFI